VPVVLSVEDAKQSELSKVLDSVPSDCRRDLGLDVMAAILDAGHRVTGAVGQVPPTWVLIVAVLESVIALADQAVGPDDIATSSDEWLLTKGSPRRRYLLRRYGAATIDEIEKAFVADKKALARPVLQLGTEIGPFFEAISIVMTIAGGGSLIADEDVTVDPERPWESLLEELGEFFGVKLPSLGLSRPNTGEAVCEFLDSIHPVLTRKYRGARAVLESDNPDRVSQAANSLIELIDRLLRLIATEEDVLAWCREAEEKDLVRKVSEGVYRPTKRGQLRYFVHFFIGDWSNEAMAQSGAQDIRLALALTGHRVRAAAEKQKHADGDDISAGTATVRRLLRGVESVLYVISDFQDTKTSVNDLMPYLTLLSSRTGNLVQWAANDAATKALASESAT
jgi:hypothetical protein